MKNAISETLAAIAEATGMDVSKVEDRNTARTILVKMLVEQHGLKVDAAHDLVWGEGAFDRMKNQIAEEFAA